MADDTPFSSADSDGTDEETKIVNLDFGVLSLCTARS